MGGAKRFSSVSAKIDLLSFGTESPVEQGQTLCRTKLIRADPADDLPDQGGRGGEWGLKEVKDKHRQRSLKFE